MSDTSKRRARNNNRSPSKKSEPFVMLHKRMLCSQQYIALSNPAKVLLTDIAIQYQGTNNGDMCAARSTMLKRGWTSDNGRTKAVKELVAKGFLELTRQGDKRRPNLYALSWFPIDECDGKLDVKSTTTASNAWNRAPETNSQSADKAPKRPMSEAAKGRLSGAESLH